MESTATRVDRGTFVWHELLANDLDAAVDFYRHVIGWNTKKYDFPGNDGPDYTMWIAGEAPVGGVMQIDKETMGDMPAGWTGYVHAPDVDATLRQAKDLGGSVLAEPMDLATVGRMAGLIDPQGASFWVLAPAPSEPIPEPPASGTFYWNELATTNYEAAYEFYHRLFGCRHWDDIDMGGGFMYRMFGHGEKMYGGMYNKTPDVPASNWMFYVTVDDIEGAVDRVRERGGRVIDGPMEVPGGDRVAMCRDPEGNAFGLHEGKK